MPKVHGRSQLRRDPCAVRVACRTRRVGQSTRARGVPHAGRVFLPLRGTSGTAVASPTRERPLTRAVGSSQRMSRFSPGVGVSEVSGGPRTSSETFYSLPPHTSCPPPPTVLGSLPNQPTLLTDPPQSHPSPTPPPLSSPPRPPGLAISSFPLRSVPLTPVRHALPPSPVRL